MRLLLLLLMPLSLQGMDFDQPRYHFNQHHLKKDKKAEKHEMELVQPIVKPNTPPVINHETSTKFKLAVAFIGGCSTITAAIISAIFMYYYKTC